MQRYITAGGEFRYRARYRDDAGRERSKTYATEREAAEYDEEVRRMKALGVPVPVPAARGSLSRWASEWWPHHARTLDRSTVMTHEYQWAAHIEDRLGAYPIRRLAGQPSLIVRWRDELLAEGVSAATVKRTMAVLSACFTGAVERGVVRLNPVRGLRRPKTRRTRAVRAFPPEIVEAIRLELLLYHRAGADPLAPRRDAMLWSLLAYAGPRPSEALALRWRDVRERTIVLDKARQLDLRAGDPDIETETKTRRFRTTDLLPVLGAELRAWRRACGSPPDSAPVFPGASPDGFWTADQYRSFRRRAWSRAVRRVAAADPERAHVARQSPYAGRHSFVSLMLRCGGPGGAMIDPLVLAQMTGHAVETMYSTYAHEIAEYRHGERVPANLLIERARAAALSDRLGRTRHRRTDDAAARWPHVPRERILAASAQLS